MGIAKKLNIITFLLFIIFICALLLFFLKMRSIPDATQEQTPENFVHRSSTESFSEKSVEIVVARYNEPLEWIKQEPFNKYHITIYNKGDNEDFVKTDNVKRVVKLKNVGREGHSYLSHIINNYENLPEITVFLPGSNDLSHKMNIALRILTQIEESGNAHFVAQKTENVKNLFRDFKMDSHQSSHEKNRNKNSDSNMEKSQIRPFGKWFESTFGDIVVSEFSYSGVFSVAKQDILNHPLEYYKKLEAQLSTSSNPEVGHYFERSWAAVFHPMTNTKIV